MTKYEKVSALYASTAKEVVQDGTSWKEYLTTASRLYKYSFQDQLLIHAQRPEATACASLEIWNQAMHCWVNRGAKGIALLDRNKLKYVFDISDVRKGKMGHFPKLWEMQEKYTESILNRLEDKYGRTNPTMNFMERICEITDRIAQNYYPGERGEIYRQTLSDSIAYTVLRRCGIEQDWLRE